MIVERVPDFLSSRYSYMGRDSVGFDRNGRFIYIKRYIDGSTPIFLIYDIMFNSFVELTADTSVSKLELGEHFLGQYFYFIQSINTEQLLFLHGVDDLTHLLILFRLDLKQKSYGVIDKLRIERCQPINLMRDEETFGLFFKTSEDGEWVNDIDNENSKFALMTFKIQENRIVQNTTIKKFNHRPYNDRSLPADIYLRRDKLWLIRNIDGPYLARFIRPGQQTPPRDPADEDLHISYFDLNEECPVERQVDKIKLSVLESPEISNLTWVQDSMIVQLTETKFDVFDLLKCAWSPESIDYSGQFYSGTTSATQRVDKEWVTFKEHNKMHVHWADLPTIHIDDQFVLSAINRKSATLHLIPLRNPHKLMNICWMVALNAGLLESNKNLLNLPHSSLF